MTEISVSRRKRIRQLHCDYPSERGDQHENSFNSLANNSRARENGGKAPGSDSESLSDVLTLGRRNERVRSLLTEAVTLLCKNSVFYRTELTIEGLLGVTVDSKEVFLVNINQKVNNNCSTGVSDHSDDDEGNGYKYHDPDKRLNQSSTGIQDRANRTSSPPRSKRFKPTMPHQTVVLDPKNQESLQHISTAVPITSVDWRDSIIDKQDADCVYDADVQFDPNECDLVVKSEPVYESDDNLDYAEHIYDGVSELTRNYGHSVNMNGRHTAGTSNVINSDYDIATEAPKSYSSNWNTSVDITGEGDLEDSVTLSDIDDEPYIASSAIFPIATTVPSRLAKTGIDTQMTSVANTQGIQTPAEQGMLLPTGGIEMNCSPTSEKYTEPNRMLLLWSAMQHTANSELSDGQTIKDENSTRMDVGNPFTDIRANLSSNGLAMNTDTCSPKLKCKICGKMIASRTAYSRHLKTHLGHYFTCSICQRPFNRKDNLKRHYAMLHQTPFVTQSTPNASNETTFGPTQNESVHCQNNETPLGSVQNEHVDCLNESHFG